LKKVLSHASLLMFLLATITHAQSLSVNPTSVTLSAMAGTNTAVSSTITISTSSNSAVTYTASNSNTANSWLTVAASSTSTSGPSVTLTAPGSLAIFANPSALPTGMYSGTVVLTPLNGTGSSINIPVTFYVSTIGVSPTSVQFSYQQNSSNFPQGANLEVTGSSVTQYTVQVPSSCTWLVVSPSSGTTSPTSPSTHTAVVNDAVLIGLTPSTYTCNVNFVPANSTSTPFTLPVSLTVSVAPTITAAPSSISMNFQVGFAAPSQTLTLTSNGTQAVSYSLSVQYAQSTGWITLSKTSGSLTPPGNTDTVTVSYQSSAALPAGTYNGQINVDVGNAQVLTIPVQLVVSNSPLLNVTPSAVNFTSQLNGSSPAPVTVQATITSGVGTINIGSVSTSSGGNWLSASVGTTITSATTACPAPPCTPITITANSSSLPTGTYNGTVPVFGSDTANTQTIQVTLAVANNALISTNVSTSTAAPLTFAYQAGSSATAPPPQAITVTSTTGATLSYSAAFATTTSSCGNWLTLSGATTGNTAGSFTATANPSGITPPSSGAACGGTITISATNPATGAAAPNSPYTIPVALFVSSNALLSVTPATVPAFTAQVGNASSPLSQNCTTNGSTNCVLTVSNTSTTDSLTVTVNATTSDSVNWPNGLFAEPTTVTIQPNASVTLTIGLVFVPSTAGTYSATVTLTATAASGKTVLDSPWVIPVTLQVTAATLTPSPTSLNFTQTAGGPAPATQTITVSSSSGAVLNFSASVSSSTPWLTVSPTSGATPTTITVTANGSTLNPSSTPYTGQITLTAPGAAPVNVTVNLTVSGGTISATPTSLTFTQAAGGSAPAAQTITVSGTPGALNFTTSAGTTTGGNWLTASPTSGTTPGSVSVSVSAGTLAVGTYNGTVTITSSGATGSPISVPVTLMVVTPQTLTVSPTTLTFTAITGQSSPASQTVSISSSGTGATFTAAATTASGGTWLTVSPTSGVTPAQLTVSVATPTLAAGNYTGTITINSPNAVAPLTLTVNLTVATIPTPVIAAVKNAASYAVGGVAPGENIVIGGTGIGPATLTGLVLTSSGAVATTVANTQVLFDGIAAPIIYVSATQSSVMVPYEIAGRATTNLTVVYEGVSSTPVPYNVLSVQPGIYTQNASGTGPGSILNTNYSVNGPNNAAALNSVVAVYMTGEGVTTPASTTGGVAPTNGSGLNKPVGQVTATVGGVAATVDYAGSAPGEVYGVMQVNITIPAGLTAGAQPVVITVGGVQTQTGVTVTVQ
jgi:trimeric autotransporter adhesin